VNFRPVLRERASNAYRHAARFFKGFVLGDRMEREAARWFRDRGDQTLRLNYPLSSASVVFDCGGYEGDWAASIREKYGCSVFVFEPVQVFLDGIRKRFEGDPFIHAFGYGLHSCNEHTTISLAGNASSTFVDAGSSEAIELRDVAEVLAELKVSRIDLIKINIEGGEFDLLERLLDTGLIGSIDHVQVQFHRFVPAAATRRQRIRERLAASHALQYDYDFIWESWSKR
jgi:FkbM family methyltransferase